MTKYSTPLRDGDKVVDDDALFRVYTVALIDGERTRLASGDVSGWVDSSKIVAFEQAIDFYTREIASDPSNAPAYHFRGVVWRYKNNYNQAISDFSGSIRINPRALWSFIVRGQIYSMNLKNYESAIADFNRAIEIKPTYAAAYGLRGYAWSEKGDHDKAIADFSEAIRLIRRTPRPSPIEAMPG